jgi:hypothetical protein
VCPFFSFFFRDRKFLKTCFLNRQKSEKAFNTLRAQLESTKKNSLGQFVAAIKEGSADEEQFPQLTAWLDVYSEQKQEVK